MNGAILIVDDDEIIVEILKELFEAEGYNVKKAFNGEEGVKEIYDDGIDLVLLDIRMPKMNGYDVCKIIREHKETYNLPVIVLTAHNTLEARERFKGMNIEDIISKPFNPEYLIQRVKKALGNYK
ncbi:MAG: response regulator [bacterium]